MAFNANSSIIPLVFTASIRNTFVNIGSGLKKASSATWRFIKKAYTGKFRFLVIALTAIIFLYLMYFAFEFRVAPSPGGRDNYWKDARNLAFHVVAGLLFITLVAYGFHQYYHHRLTYRKAAVIIALAGAVFVMIYGLSTPIYDYGGTWNQHDVYYGSTGSRYYMADRGILDGGGGHFGMIMTVYRYNIIPEIKYVNGAYDFSFSGVLERYQPKLFYIISGWYMRFNSLFIGANDAIVQIGDSTAYGLTNQEWALYESLRLLYTMMEWLQIYFIYKIFVRLHLRKKGLLIAFALAIFNPMWCYFANWTNNDGMSTFFAIVGLYYAICYYQDRKTYQLLLCAVGVGASMACKLGGALIAIVIAPMMIFVFVKSIIASRKGEKIHKMPAWVWVGIQFLLFALIVFPLGLGFPIYSKIRFGQDIAYFSPVNNDALYIQNESFFERFILFPNSDTFRLLWVYHSNKDTAAGYFQDTSLITAIIKTSLYGEYGFGLSSLQCLLLYISALALIFAMMIICCMRIGLYFYDRKWKVDVDRTYTFAAIIAVFYGWAVYFVNSFPHTCNEDMRYIAVIILPLCGIVGSTYQRFEERPTQNLMTKISRPAIVILTGIFVFVAFGCYLTLSPWYYR